MNKSVKDSFLCGVATIAGLEVGIKIAKIVKTVGEKIISMKKTSLEEKIFEE